MIYSPAVYMITEGNDQRNSNGQEYLHFIQWIIAPWTSLLLSWKLQSRHDKTAWVTLWSRTHLSGSLTVFIVPRGNGKSMELACQSQCTYRLSEVTVRKDLAQQSTQKTLKGPQGHFQLNGDMAHQYCTSAAVVHFLHSKRNGKTGL